MSKPLIDLETCSLKTFTDFIDTLKKSWPVFVSTQGIDKIRYSLDDRVSKYVANTNNKNAISQFQKKVIQMIPKQNTGLNDKIYYNDKYKILYNSKTKEAFVLQKPDKFFTRKFK